MGTHQGTDMSYLFSVSATSAYSFNEDIGTWATGGVTDMEYLFY